MPSSTFNTQESSGQLHKDPRNIARDVKVGLDAVRDQFGSIGYEIECIRQDCLKVKL